MSIISDLQSNNRIATCFQTMKRNILPAFTFNYVFRVALRLENFNVFGWNANQEKRERKEWENWKKSAQQFYD